MDSDSRHDIAITPDSVLQAQVSITVPDDIDDARTQLDSLGNGINAGGWATSAVVYAFTTNELGRGDKVVKSDHFRLPFAQFAALGVRGLTTRNTVRKYRNAWQQAIDKGWTEPSVPGREALLPQQDFKLGKGRGDDPDGDEWYTPSWLFDGLGLHFDVDVCAPTNPALRTCPADTYLTESDDGLSQEWSGLVWCNPPYSTPEDWALRTIDHNNGLLLTHMPMNAAWCAATWQHTSGLRLFQAMDFVRPDGSYERPGYWLQLAAFGKRAATALAALEIPDAVRDKGAGRVPSPVLRPT